MKKRLIITLLFLKFSVLILAQSLITEDSIIKINPSGSKYPLVQKILLNDKSAKPDTTERTVVFMETGDGFFTTNPTLDWQILSKQTHPPLAFFTRIYDTTKFPPPTKITCGTKSSIKTESDFTYSEMYNNLLNKVGVKIVPNTYEIVPGDPMVFALIYNCFELIDQNNGLTRPIDSSFKLYFFYNNNRTFDVLSSSNKTFKPSGSSEIFSNCRVHNGEVVNFDEKLINKKIRDDFENYICFSISNDIEGSKAVFISFNPFSDLQLGKSGSVYAVLTNSKDSIIGTDKISNMLFSPAHDPNYIVASPYCLKNPKKEYPFKYTVHFQNTGAGNAIEVKTVIKLSSGFNWSTFKVDKASFAGADYINVLKLGKNILIDSIKNIITVQFYNNAIPSELHMLKGTADTATERDSDGVIEEINIISAKNTMGDFIFSIQSTVNTDDILPAYAEIYFKSEHPSSYTINGYEPPVRTNIATTKYKDCCNCDDPPIILPNCFIIFGLCWWWWLLILIVSITFYIVYKKRKGKNSPSGN